VATHRQGAQATVTVRLDRARCRSCQATHVPLPAELLARRSYPLRVIGAALAIAGQVADRGQPPAGLGHRPRRCARGCAAEHAFLKQLSPSSESEPATS
jgi:hypothetical protein